MIGSEHGRLKPVVIIKHHQINEVILAIAGIRHMPGVEFAAGCFTQTSNPKKKTHHPSHVVNSS